MDPFEAATAYFGARLSEIMDRGLTRQDIAMRLGVQGSTIGRLIGGSRVNPHLDTVLRAAFAFDMEPAELLPTLADLKAMVEASGAPGPDQD